MKQHWKILPFALLTALLCGCGISTDNVAAVPVTTDVSSESPETMTSEEIYKMAVSLLCYGDADYRQNKAAKELFEIIRDYKDSETYLGQIYEVCTAIDGRGHNEFIYDEYGHILLERGNPYYETDEGDPVYDGVIYEYADGRITGEQYPTGDAVSYSYDKEGYLAAMVSTAPDGSSLAYTYSYETDEEGRIIKRTAYLDGLPAGEIANAYRMEEDGYLSVLQTDTVPARSPEEKERLLTFNSAGQLIQVDRDEGTVTYSYGYVWMPEHDPGEEFVFEHRIRLAYF